MIQHDTARYRMIHHDDKLHRIGAVQHDPSSTPDDPWQLLSHQYTAQGSQGKGLSKFMKFNIKVFYMFDCIVYYHSFQLKRNLLHKIPKCSML